MQLNRLGLNSEIKAHCLVFKPPMGFELTSGLVWLVLGSFRVESGVLGQDFGQGFGQGFWLGVFYATIRASLQKSPPTSNCQNGVSTDAPS